MNRLEFLGVYGEPMQKICSEYGIPASVCIAQAIIESGWDEYCIGEFNVFGRKYNGTGARQDVVTQEFINGEYITVVDHFQVYGSIEEAVTDYCILITQDEKYAEVYALAKGELEPYVQALASVYATAENDDHAYSKLILEVIAENDLTEYDQPLGKKASTKKKSNA